MLNSGFCRGTNKIIRGGRNIIIFSFLIYWNENKNNPDFGKLERVGREGRSVDGAPLESFIAGGRLKE